MRNQNRQESREGPHAPHVAACEWDASEAITRRRWLGAAAGLAGGALVGGGATPLWAAVPAASLRADPIAAYVYRDMHNGCCNGWIGHLEQNGYRVMAANVADLDTFKRQLGVPRQLWACHTALVDSYIIEGHVPVDVIDRARHDRPDIRGLAVPGHPPGAPGVEGNPEMPLAVIAFTLAGDTFVYTAP